MRGELRLDCDHQQAVALGGEHFPGWENVTEAKMMSDQRARIERRSALVP